MNSGAEGGIVIGEEADISDRIAALTVCPAHCLMGLFNLSLTGVGYFTTNQLIIRGGDHMPGFDRTGPMGAGPMTGGARGFCNPATSGAVRSYGGWCGYGYGRGMGFRRGFRSRGGYGPPINQDFRFAPTGRGWGRGFGRGYMGYPVAVAPPVYPMDAPDEIDMLRAQADSLKASLDAVNRRIDVLESKPTESE